MYNKSEMKITQKYQKIYKYIAVLEPDKEVGGFTVTVPALPGCISEGDTFEEALKNIKEAAELYLEVMGKDDEEIPIETEPVFTPIEIRV